jgi:hypothetical protein
MKRLQQIATICLCLYLLYVLKSALGIDLHPRYHAGDLVRIPAKFIRQKLLG